jgi:hypothetical protein
VEEADESILWCELLHEAGLSEEDELKALLSEARELTAIFSSGRKNARLGKV